MLPTYSDKNSPNFEFYLQPYSDELEAYLNPPKLLTSNCFEKTLLCSYPRSGNTLLRSLMENLTGILTGSDCAPSWHLNKDLFDMGLKAEGIMDDRVWMVKTHYPERAGTDQLRAKKCILVVRNPLDCIMSLFHMIGTGSHNSSVHPDDLQ